MSALQEDSISRTKKVLNMVDGYFYNQNSETRGELRKHLMDEFDKYTKLQATIEQQAAKIAMLEEAQANWAHLNHQTELKREAALERIRVSDAEEPKLLPPVMMDKALTVLMQTDDGDNEAERYLANIDDGCAFVVTKSEMFFHQLRLSVAKNPEIANKVSVLFYQDGEYKKVGLGYEDELRWPVGFLEGAWSMEIEISKVREAIRKNADQPKKN